QQAEAEAKRQAELAAKQQAEAEAKKQAELAAKQQAEADAKRQADLAAKQQADLAAKQQADLAAKQQAEAEAKKQARSTAQAPAQGNAAPEKHMAEVTPGAASKADKEAPTFKVTAEANAGIADSATVTVRPRVGRVVIQPRNNLWKLSRVIYGRGVHYRVIFAANKNQIRDPDRIYPGQIFTIPNASPPESIDPKRKKPLSPEEGAGTPE
ncbi:MAG: LysM peptidoglycan-binding domain-containing protein, partial [Hyphomicrobiales bacterium]